MNSRKRHTRTDAVLSGALKGWADRAAPLPSTREQLLRRAQQPGPARAWRLLWRWLNTWPVANGDRTGELFASVGMHSLVNEMLALRLVA